MITSVTDGGTVADPSSEKRSHLPLKLQSTYGSQFLPHQEGTTQHRDSIPLPPHLSLLPDHNHQPLMGEHQQMENREWWSSERTTPDGYNYIRTGETNKLMVSPHHDLCCRHDRMAQHRFLPVTAVLSHALLLLLSRVVTAELRTGFYSETCPGAESAVREVMRRSMAREPRSAASVMRLQFHDCFVNGCDASLLLDDTPSMVGEKLALANINSLRSYEVIDEAKAALEEACPGVVSCADVIVMASRDAVALSEGPSWEVKLGRKDSLTASQDDSDRVMPSPRSNATRLIDLFSRFNLSAADLVALSGSHSIGKARCFSVAFRLYNQSGTGRPDPDMDPVYRARLDRLCPRGGDGNATGALDATPAKFDNQYFKDLARRRGFLNSDQTLFSGSQLTRRVVRRYADDEAAFFRAFAEGMVKMGDIQSGEPGEVRRNCRVVNHG